jgi:purine nucleoside permease
MNISQTKCDQCGKESENKNLGGGLQERPRAWIKVMHDSAAGYMTEHKDFCSLLCLERWAMAQNPSRNYATRPSKFSVETMGLVK